jgi:HlyD family secretion protein
MKTPTRTTLLAVAAASLAFGLIGCGPSGSAGAGGERGAAQTLEPTSAKVVRRDIVGYELLVGNLYVPPESQAHAYAPYRAPVERVNATVGARVRKGEVIVELAAPEVQSNYEQHRIAVKEAETAYANAKVQYQAPVRQAEQALAQARSTERTIRKATVPGGDATALEQAVANRQAAEEALLAAKTQVNTDVLPYKQQLDAARSAFEQAQAGVKQTSVRAPLSGHVLEMRAKPGDEVGAQRNEVLATIVDLADIKVKAEVTDAQAGIVKDRTPVVITFTDLPQRPFDGRVTRVRTVPEDEVASVGKNARYLATIDFKNDEGLVKPGMEVKTVGVKTGSVQNVIAVPYDAVDQDETGKPVVKVLVNGEWQVRVVETGLSDGSYTQIKSGLKEGETVQVTP